MFASPLLAQNKQSFLHITVNEANIIIHKHITTCCDTGYYIVNTPYVCILY